MMREPPPLATCFRYPITTGIAFLAVVATVRWQTGASIEQFTFNDECWWREPWRLLTPVLFHVNAFHLLFNLYWFWIFGSQIEQAFGSGRTLGINVLLAVGSGIAEVALLDGGVGLSGVVYGQFGLLWVLGRTDSRFRDIVDHQTAQWMIGWFFLCIAMTVAGQWNIGNVAHGSGWILGMLLGWTIAARGAGQRFQRSAVLAVVFSLCMIGGTVARPYVSWSKDYGVELAHRGYQALEEGDSERAVFLYQRAVAIDPQSNNWWHNLGVAYHRAGRMKEAEAALARAAALEKQ
jgi:membrane associated rhomboid family serine protease